jgi:hypothetical protein
VSLCTHDRQSIRNNQDRKTACFVRPQLLHTGHEWMIGVSVSFSSSILHLKLTPNKLTP